MSKKALVGEHEHLVKTLRKGSRKERLTEAKEQASELKQYRSAKRGMRKTDRS